MKSFSLIQSGPGHEERAEAARRDAEIGLEDALELEQRLVVEADVGQVLDAMPGLRCRQYATACAGNAASPFLRVKRSSWAAATISPSRSRQAALSW